MAAMLQPSQQPVQSHFGVNPGVWHWQQQLRQAFNQPIQPCERLDWMLKLRDNMVFTEKNNELFNRSLALAEQLCDWPLVIFLRTQLQQQLPPGDAQIDNCLMIADAYCRLGDVSSALQVVHSRLLLDYQTERLLEYYRNLQGYQHDLPFGLGYQAGQVLRLMPLTESYIEDFYWAYDDPQIAKMCNLPDFETDDQWLQWLKECNSDPSRRLFAVLHQDWGFIGSVSLECHNGIGYFYYWIYRDLQGNGFGPQAVQMLLDLGQDYLSMSCCYAKAFATNIASQKGMNKLGFHRIDLAAQPPYDNEWFFYRGPERNNAGHIANLDQLFDVGQEDYQIKGAMAWRMGIEA